MEPGLGKLEGRGEVRGPDGELKATFTLSADCSQGQAEKTAQALNATLEVKEASDGSHPRSDGS